MNYNKQSKKNTNPYGDKRESLKHKHSQQVKNDKNYRKYKKLNTDEF